MDATSEVAMVSASSATTSTVIHTPTNAFNVNHNNNVHIHANTHSGSLATKAANNVISVAGSSNSSSSNSSSSCSSSSTSSNSSGYGSTTTTPTNNYDLQQTTPTTTPIPKTPAALAEHIIPVATVATVAPFYNESITTHNLDTNHVQHHHHHSQQQQQQQLQQQPHHLLQTNHHQFSQNHLHPNLQQQHHQYLSRQQYYHPYDYQQTSPTHNIAGSAATPAVASYNMLIPGPYELSSSPITASYSAGQYKASSSTSATNYDGSTGVRTNVAAPTYNQQQQHGEQQQSKVISQQTQHLTSLLASSKQRSSALISNTANTNTSKPQAAATPFYANPTPFYDNFKHKMPLEYHDTYGSPSPPTATTYQQQQKYYAAAKSQLKEASYGSSAGLNSKSLYPNSGNYFSGPAGGLNLSSASYDKYMYPNISPTGYPTAGHMGNEQNPTEVSNYRKPVVGNAMNSPSWPWGIDYASGNSRSIPPPASHLPTATVAPTHATHLAQNSSVLAREPYYMGHDKYGVKYDKYTAPAYQQSYVSPPANRHIWPNTPHASNLTQLNERHLLAAGPPALPSHGLHAASYFPNNSTTGLNSRQSCCSQLYQPQSVYYPPSHPVPPRMPHSQSSTVAPPTGGYLTAQQPLGQSPHLNALSASCKYGGVLPDYGGGNKLKNSNDLYLNPHHYDNNPATHTFGYGSGHNSQQLYATNAHQSLAHESTPASLLTNDPLNSNPTSYTNDLSLTTSNFDNYHTHLNTPHPSQQALAGIHNQQPPPAYGPSAAKRALLDYRKPIQPQPPPAIAEDCYTTLTPRDHYIQHELLNTPETTTTYGEYEVHQNNTTLSTLSQPTAVLADPDRATEESNKNLSLRDFIANWNDDEDEYQNTEEMSFDQDSVIDEVLQTAPVIREAAAVIVEEVKVIKPASPGAINHESLKEPVKTVESLAIALNDPDANQYVNLPDIVIDIEKSNNINNSIITPTTSPTPPPQDEANNTSLNLNLTTFDVEKELDELNLKKPAPQELTKDIGDIKDSGSATTLELSPCKSLTSQLSFEDLNLEPANKTVLNAITTRLTSNHSSELNDQYFKDIEGYESSSSRHSNESAFEKEYETFINKITSESSAVKSGEDKTDGADKEIDFVQNVHEFSKFYKRKRKLRESELKSSVQATQNNKKPKTTVETEVDNSNFPQVYTKKSRKRLKKSKLQSPRRRKPISAYYKIIHSIRRFGLYRQKCVREYMTELKEKHLPLIKRQSIKNYTHETYETLFNAKSLKALCIMAINTDEFHQSLMLTIAQEQESCAESEEKHICMDPTCETCEVIKSLMEADSFETTIMQQASIFCGENNNESMTILQDTPNTVDLNFRNEGHIMISSAIENVQYSKENFPAFDTKDLDKESFNSIDTETYIQDFHKTEATIGLESCYERSECSNLDLQTTEGLEISLQPTAETEAVVENFEREKLVNPSMDNTSAYCEQTDAANFAEHSNNKLENSCNAENISTEFNILSSSTETKTADSLSHEKFSSTKQDQESESEVPIAKTSACCELTTLEQPDAPEPERGHASNCSTKTNMENSRNAENISTEFNMLSSNTETKNTDPLNQDKFSSTKQDQESESEASDSSSDTESSSSSYDTEDDSGENCKNSYRKSNSSNESSDTDTEDDIDDENAISLDSNQSYHSKEMKPNNSSANTKTVEILEADNFYNDENEIQKPSPAKTENERKDAIVTDDTKTEFKDCTPMNMQCDVNTDSESEDEHISNSPQRIVIRITKSLSPNDQSLRVENVFGKSLNETKNEEIAKTKTEIIPKLGMNQPNSVVENVLEKALKTQIDSEMEDNGTAAKKSKIISPPLKLVLRRNDSIEDQAARKPIIPHTEEGESDSESEFEDGDISETDSIADTTTLNQIQECAYEKSIEKLTDSELEEGEILEKEPAITTCLELSSAKETDDKCDVNTGNDSEMISIESSHRDQLFEQPLEPHSKFDDPETVSETKSQVVATSSKLSSKPVDFFNDYSSENSYGSYTDSDSEGTISENKFEIISASSTLWPNQEIFKKLESFEKCVQAPVNIDSEFEDEDSMPKEKSEPILTSLRLKSIQDDSKNDNGFLKATKIDAFHNSLQIKSDAVTNSLHDSLGEHSSQNTVTNDLEYNTDDVHQTTKLSSTKTSHHAESETKSKCNAAQQDDFKKEKVSKESTQEDIKTYILSDSEDESDKEEEESSIDIYSEGDGQGFNPSDYESIYDSEQEMDDDDETLEQIKMLRKYDSKPIVISDNESINSYDANEELQQTFTSAEQFESFSELPNSNESLESETDEDNEKLKETEKIFAEKDLVSSNKSFDLDFKVMEKCKDEKETIVIDQSEEEDEFPDSEASNTKLISANTEIRQGTEVIKATEYLSDHSNSSENSDEQIIEQFSDQSSTYSRKSCNNNEYYKNIDDEDVSLDSPENSEKLEDILETTSLKENQSFLKTFDCESKLNIGHVLEQSKLQTCVENNVLEKIETEDSNTIEKRCEVLQILPEKTSRVELKTTEKEERIESSNTLPEVNELNHLAESANKLYNSQNHVQEIVIADSKCGSSSAIKDTSNIFEEIQNLESKLNEIIMKYQTTESEEALEETKDPASETCNINSEQKVHTPQDIIEECVTIEEAKKVSNILESGVLETKEIIAQITTIEININSEATAQETNLVDSEEIIGAEELSKSPVSTTLDSNCKDQSTEECESISKTHTELFEDANNLESIITERTAGNTETSHVYCESAYTKAKPLSPSDATNTTDLTGSEIISEGVTEGPYIKAKLNNKEILDKISKEKQTNADSITKKSKSKFQDTIEEPSSNRPADKSNENMENVANTEAEKSEVIAQAASQNIEMLENKNKEKLEIAFDHDTTINEHAIIKESVSKLIPNDDKSQQEEEKEENSIIKETQEIINGLNAAEIDTQIFNIFEEKSGPTDDFELNSDIFEEVSRGEEEENSIRKETQKIITDLKAKMKDLEHAAETDTNISNVFGEKSIPTKEFELNSDIFEEVSRGEILQQAIDEEKSASTDFLNLSINSLATNIENGESDLMAQENTSQNLDEAHQIASLAECASTNFENSCKVITETSESLRVQKNYEEVGIEIQNILKLRNSNNLEDAKASEEGSAVDREYQLKNERGISLDNTEIPERYEENSEEDHQNASKDKKFASAKAQTNEESNMQKEKLEEGHQTSSRDKNLAALEVQANEESYMQQEKLELGHQTSSRDEKLAAVEVPVNEESKIQQEKLELGHQTSSRDEKLAAVKDQANEESYMQQEKLKLGHQTFSRDEKLAAVEDQANEESNMQQEKLELGHQTSSRDEKLAAAEVKANEESYMQQEKLELGHQAFSKDDKLAAVEDQANEESYMQQEKLELGHQTSSRDDKLAAAEVKANEESYMQQEKLELGHQAFSKDDKLAAVEDQANEESNMQQEKLELGHQTSSRDEKLAVVEGEVNEDSNMQLEKLELGQQTSSRDEKLATVEVEANEESNMQHQTETFKLSLLETSSENVLGKNCVTPDDLSADFFGFKHQCSFEDESEDFHGFEDLEEVTRIRQEIENLNDDSTANDGFLNHLTLDRETHKSSASSLTESTFSELNELEALEKELSQPQQEIQTDDEDKETEKQLATKLIEVVSSNDIQHVKQMLESDEEQQTDGADKKENLAHKCKDKSLENSKNISKVIISSIHSVIPKLSDLCRAALNSSLNSNSNLAQQHTDTSTILVQRELSVEEALAEMYRQAGVLLSDPEECENDTRSQGDNEAHDVLLINLQEILNSDNNEVYVLQCDINENVLNVVPSTEQHEEELQHNEVANAERVNTVQFILDTQNPEQHIHIISSDSESEVIILSDDDSDFSRRPFRAHQERITIPFINDGDINDSDSLFDISTIHHEEIVPDNLKKFLQEEFYKYLHEKYVQRNISKYYHANRVLKKYKRIFLRTQRQ